MNHEAIHQKQMIKFQKKKKRQRYLVRGFNNLEKYERQWEGLSHRLWKIKFMFQTTNQILKNHQSSSS